MDADYTGTNGNSPDPIQTHFGTFYLPLCSNPSAQPVASGVIFWSFAILGPMVTLSVTLSAIAIGIVIRFDELQNAKFILEAQEVKKRELSVVMHSIQDGEDEERIDLIRDLVKFLWTGWRKKGMDISLEDADELGVFLTFTNSLQLFVNKFSFRMFMICVTMAGVCTAFLVDSNYPEIYWVQLVVQLVLTLDLIARFLLHTPYAIHFFTSSWRVADMATIILLWLPILVPSSSFNILQFLYFCRLFLAITYFFYIEELASITISVIESALPFLYVTFLLAVFFYFYAVSGIILFKEADPYHWSSIGMAINTLIQIMTMDNWTYIARNAMIGCKYIGYSTGFPKYDNMCFREGGDGIGMGWFVAIHYVSFIIISAFILLSLLVGMILSSLEMLRQEILETKQVLKKANPIIEQHDFSDEEVEKVKELFFALDVSEKGYVVFTDLFELFIILETPEEKQSTIFRKADLDSNGRIDFAEFCDLIGALKREKLPPHLRPAKDKSEIVDMEIEPTDGDLTDQSDDTYKNKFENIKKNVDLSPLSLPDDIIPYWEVDNGETNFAEEVLYYNMVNGEETRPQSERRQRRLSAKLFGAKNLKRVSV